METPPKIVFEHMAASDALRTLVLDELGKLEQFFGRITSARVAIRPPPRNHRKGSLYCTAIYLVLPGEREIAVMHEPDSDRHYENAQAAVRDAFAAARRRLQDERRILEGAVKSHSEPGEQLGRIARLMKEDGFGFIETDAGREVFFTRAKVKHRAFDSLKIGTPVYFSEDLGDEGPLATSVRIAPASAEQDAPPLTSPDRI